MKSSLRLHGKIASDDPTPTIDKIRTLWSFLPEREDEKLVLIAELRELVDGEGAKLLKDDQKERVDELRELMDVKRLGVDDLPKNILRRVFNGRRQPGSFCLHLSQRATSRRAAGH